MRALSILQPWAWAIAHGSKRIENRTWCTNFRGEFLIHTGKGFDRNAEDYVRVDLEAFGGYVLPARKDLPFGALIGVATLVDCVKDFTIAEDDPQDMWACGPWCFRLDKVRAFATPIPYKGELGFFNVPDHVVEAAINAARRSAA